MDPEPSSIGSHETVQKHLSEKVVLFLTGRACSAAELSGEMNIHSRSSRRDFIFLLKTGIIKPAVSDGFLSNGGEVVATPTGINFKNLLFIPGNFLV